VSKRPRTKPSPGGKPPSLGLAKGKVSLAAYSEEWPGLFERERAGLLAALGPALLAVEHIGSTAVPGLPAKPIIDIAAAIADLRGVESLVPPLERLGYRYLGEYGLPGRHFFEKGAPVTHHLHVVEETGEHWRVWRLFRDYLRSHPAEAERYADFKRGLAARYADDRDAYTRSKSEFVNAVLAKAGRERGRYKPPSTRVENGKPRR
jgi:GrpB-like predicted nucleotidyltransferase (UPF0157 family)